MILGFWKSKENQISYLNYLEKQLNITSPEDWYRVTKNHLISNHGYGLLNEYNSSIIKILHHLKPQLNLKPWKFYRVPAGNFVTINYHKFIFQKRFLG